MNKKILEKILFCVCLYVQCIFYKGNKTIIFTMLNNVFFLNRRKCVNKMILEKILFCICCIFIKKIRSSYFTMLNKVFG